MAAEDGQTPEILPRTGAMCQKIPSGQLTPCSTISFLFISSEEVQVL